MPYLLDSQVVSYFLQARREAALAAAAERVPCAIAEIVRDELAEDPTRGALFVRWLAASHLAVIALEIGSPAEALWSRLQPRVTPKGRGERACIALAATSSDYVFAGMDKGGMWIALRELWAPGERLISLPVFLRRLVDERALAGDAADDVMRSSSQVLPTWWADWRATA
ncbi:MAG TPA: hypothetical protein VNO30_50225 [Kofleriaceae bacterium]|nr:hypothetical protein [Kofleriaceae bacterium]